MAKKQWDEFRDQLVTLRRRVTGDVSQLADEGLRGVGGEASGNLSNTPQHMADLGTDTFEEEVTLGLLENVQLLREEINAALARMDAGTYGTCEECGQEIGKERLKALPYTRHCVSCARKLQGPVSPGA